MRWSRAHWILSAGFVASVLLAASLGKRAASPTIPALPLDDWDVPELVHYLDRAGMRLHAVPTALDEVVQHSAYLTVTEKSWHEVNCLLKTGTQLGPWQGILYCERVDSDGMRKYLVEHWGDGGGSIGPFVFYGDPELFARVRAVLLDAPLGTLAPLRFAVVIGTTAA